MADVTKKLAEKISNKALQTAKLIGKNIGNEGNQFIDLLKNFNVIGFALALIMVNNVTDLANSIINSIIMPTIQPFINRLKGEDSSIFIGKIQIKLDSFVQSSIKFLAMSIIIYIMIKFGFEIQKPVQWVSIRSYAPGLEMGAQL